MQQETVPVTPTRGALGLVTLAGTAVLAGKDTKRKLRLSDFEVGRKLGRGKYGRVFLVRERKSGFICALKSMNKLDLISDNEQHLFKSEAHIHSQLKHPYILRFYGYFYDHKRVYFLLEYALFGELYRMLQKERRFSEHKASKYIWQTAEALQYMHRKGMIHRDIKPENILLGQDGNVRLADFGFSIQTTSRRQTRCGTLDYLPPEIVQDQPYDYRVDLWELGVLVYELVVGKPPFEAAEDEEVMRRIPRAEFDIPSFVSRQAKDVIMGLLRPNPADRMTLRDLNEHLWMAMNRQQWNTF